MKSAHQILQQGVQVLAPLLESHGFSWHAGASGNSSGGEFSSGAFVRGDRRLELHFRSSLGLVSYSVAGHALPHTEFIRGQGVARGANAYPGFSHEPLDAFRHLLDDLQRFGAPFLLGSDPEFFALVEWVAAHPKPTGLAAI